MILKGKKEGKEEKYVQLTEGFEKIILVTSNE
jgi:hypothetical protein